MTISVYIAHLIRILSFLIPSIFLCSENVFAQSSYILDSLEQKVRTAPNDTARISALCKLANVYATFEQKDSAARVFGGQALQLANQLRNINENLDASYYQALALYSLGVSFRHSKLELRMVAEKYFQLALQYAKSMKNEQRSLQMQAFVQQGLFTSLRFRIDSHSNKDRTLEQLKQDVRVLLESQQRIAEKLNSNALRGQILLCRAFILTTDISQKVVFALEAARLYEQSPDVEGLTNILSFVGFFSQLISDDARAMQAYKRVVQIAEANNIPRSLAVSYQAIGDIYAKLIDTSKALEYYHRAEAYIEKYDVKTNRIELFQKLGMVYVQRNDKEKAQIYLQKALTLNNDAGYALYQILLAGQLYRQMNKLDASLRELERGRTIAEQGSANQPKADFYYELATTLHAKANAIKANNAQGNLFRNTLESALYYAQRKLAVLKAGTPSAPTPEQLLEAYSLLYGLSKELGKKEDALNYLEQQQHWEKLALARSKSLDIAAMDSRAVVDAAQAKVEALEAQDKLQRTIGVAIGITVIALMLIIGLQYQRNKERRKIARILEEQNHALNSKNEELQSLSAEKTTILGIVAHDLKNPIGAIRNLANLIVADTADHDETKKISAHIVRASNQMLDLVINLLDNNRLEEGAMSFFLVEMDLMPTLESIIQRYKVPATTKRITIEFLTENMQGKAFVDESAIIQVFDNLISNAVKYSPHGKRVFVRLTSHQSTLRVAIQDEGPGISPEDMKKLFGKFVRLTARPTGGEHSTGLGLSIVKKIVEAMNGKVWCESEMGKGATFIVELPSES